MDNKTYKVLGRQGPGTYGRPHKGDKKTAAHKIRNGKLGRIYQYQYQASLAEMD